MITRMVIASVLIILQSIDAGEQQTGFDDDWWQAVTTQIAREEYSATSSAEGLQAPNRAHNLRTHFHAGGIEIGPRASGPESAWRFGWETAWFGRRDALRAVDRATPEPNGSRVTYRRPEFDEWYDNSATGLEQGFTVHTRPLGDGPLSITGRLLSSLRAEMRPDGGAVDLLDENGKRVLRYGELHVWDAGGDEIPARLHLDGSELGILVDDGTASYPLTIDPLMQSPAWITGGNQDDAEYGIAVAPAGDVNGDGFSDVIVGAHHYDNGQIDEGRAFVYHGSATGLPIAPAWTAESNQVSAFFGRSVATAGDVTGDGFSDVIVGVPGYDNPESGEGRVYTYHGSASGLNASPGRILESNQAGASLGASVMTAGDVNGDGLSDVIIGAPGFDNGQLGEGRAFVYHGTPTGIAVIPAWTEEVNQASAAFGVSVSTAGDVNGDGFSDVIVGADGYDNPESGEGRAWVYHGSAAGVETNAAWAADPNSSGAGFGASVATAGDVNGDGFSDVIVGAPHYSSNAGRAFVYHGSTGGLALSSVWNVTAGGQSGQFGRSVSAAGDVNADGYSDVVVGAPFAGTFAEGLAYVYHGSAIGLDVSAAWSEQGNQSFAGFGNSVATAGDVNGDGISDVIVGAPGHGTEGEGRAFVYHGSAAGVSQIAAWDEESNQAVAGFGIAVASAGDVNGDGFADVIVGANHFDNGQTDEGRAFVFHGSANGLLHTAAWTAESNQSGSAFGTSVAGAGDVNGDGYSDVIVGADAYSNFQLSEGRAFVYHGSATGLAMIAAWTAESNQPAAFFGRSVARAGDVNGDGYSDVIIGAAAYQNGELDEGGAFVYHGSPSGLGPNAVWAAESNQATALFGTSSSTAGDVNGDGFSDVIVGGYLYDNGETNEGRAFVYHGSPAGLASTPDWTAESNQAEANFGISVATAGDVNGDGYSDVIVGAQLYDNGHTDEGRAFVYLGSPTGLGTAHDWSAEGNWDGAAFGRSVATAGDVNGDGFSDVIVGAYRYNSGIIDGRALVYHGSESGLGLGAAWFVESDQDQSNFGIAVTAAGDVNADGYSEVLVGANAYDNGQGNEGSAFLYYGNDGPGRRYNLRQLRTDAMTPIALLGRSDSETQFRINATMLTVYGRTRMQMEHEVKPRGVPFDGLNTLPGSFFDTGNDGQVNFGRLVTGLDPGTQYHWRVRAKYDLVKTPFQRNGPWMQVPVNGWNEADLRTAGTTSGIAMADAPRATYLLAAPRPNPFAFSSEIAYTLPASGHVRLAVYDVTGRELAVLVDGVETKGQKSMTWNGRSARGSTRLAAGVYFVRLDFSGRIETRKLVLAP